MPVVEKILGKFLEDKSRRGISSRLIVKIDDKEQGYIARTLH